MAQLQMGNCEHCRKEYRYELWHTGFADLTYAYCDACGMLATLNLWDPRWSKLPTNSSGHREIETILEPFLESCICGGKFRKGSQPRCPHCKFPLSAEYAASFIEDNAPGTAKGWRWQRSWSGLYCIAIEDLANPGTLRRMKDPYLA
jgi:hypothetical protein